MLEHYLAFSGLVFILVAAPIMVGVCLLILIQTWTVARKLDRYFFNTKYFSAQEMDWYDHAPWSWMKTLWYIRFITFPASMRKRFGQETVLDKVNWFDHFLARATIILFMVVCVFLLNVTIAVIINFIRIGGFSVE